MASIDSADVFVASTVWGPACCSNWRKIFCFSSSFSTAASMTRSTRASETAPATGVMRSSPAVASAAVKIRRLAASRNIFSAAWSPLASISGAISFSRTG